LEDRKPQVTSHVLLVPFNEDEFVETTSILWESCVEYSSRL